jgi:uncharacterized protein with HEPN domain/predicted nucleotidyltransferase
VNKVVQQKLPDLIRICESCGIRRLELFGSAARDDFQPASSDLDFAVTFEKSARPGGFELYLEVLREFEDLFGRKVDLLEAEAITNPFLLDAIAQDRLVLCEARNGNVMAKQPETYLHDAATALAAIERYIEGKNLEHYLRDDLLQAAVERRFEIAAEALNQLSKTHPSLVGRICNLPAVIAFRNVLAHEYGVVNNRTVWELAQKRAPALRKELEKLLQNLSAGSGGSVQTTRKKKNSTRSRPH